MFNLGQSAEFNLYQDPVTASFKIRQFGERLTEKLFEEHKLEFPAENSFHNRIKTLEFGRILPNNIKDLFFHIKEKGNIAVHQNKATVDEAKHALFLCYKISKWFYETYATVPADITAFKFQMPAELDTRHALYVLETDYKNLEQRFEQLLQERQTTGLPEETQQVIQQRSEKAASKIDQLPQALLAKAFRGELVPQDPQDEPASVLLQKIKAAQASTPKAKKTKGENQTELAL